MNLNKLVYPKKSHRKPVSIPADSIKLAELVGILFGDGEVSTPWQFVISLNSIADFHYSFYVKNLIGDLFILVPTTIVRKKEMCLKIIASSVTVVDFLVDKGVTRGNKVAQQFNIPRWIFSNNEYERYFIRGLFDTDGCFYTHKHRVGGKEYVHLGFCFASFSLPLVNTVAQILRKYGINPHIERKGTRICFYSQKDIIRYLEVIGSSNPRIYTKFSDWRGVRVD